MIDISSYPLPAFQILIWGVVFLVLAYAMRPRRRVVLRHMITPVLALTSLLCSGSAALKHKRHAGTRIQSTYGWPKPMYAQWLSDETGDRTGAFIARGVAENAFFYGTLSILLVAAGARLKHKRSIGAQGRMD